MRVLLIQPPISDYYHTSIRTYPLGLLYLAEVIKQECEVKLLDLRTGFKPKEYNDSFFEDLSLYYRKDKYTPFSFFSKFYYFGMDKTLIKKKISEISPDLICISSLFSSYFYEALEIAKISKEINKEIPVLLGGNHSTCFPKQVLMNKEIDFVIRGEGETPILHLIGALKSRKGFNDIKGLCYKKADQITLSQINIEKNINITPARELLDASKYKIGKDRYAFLISSRGCPKKCSFCGKPPYPFRKININTIKQDIEKCMSLGISHLDFEDDMLTLDKGHFNDILNLLKDKKLTVTAMNGIYYENLDEAMLYQMYLAGFRRLNISLVDLSPRVLGSQNRFFANINSIIEACDEKNFYTEIHFIIGLPGQRPLDVINTLIFLMEQRCLPAPSIFYLAPGSPIFESLKTHINLKALRSSYMIELNPNFNRKNIYTLILLSRFINFTKAFIDKYTDINYLSELPPLLADQENMIFSLLFNEKKFYAIDNNNKNLTAEPINRELVKIFFEKAKGRHIKGFKTKNRILFDI